MKEWALTSQMVYPELKTTYCLNDRNTNFHIWRSKVDFVLFDNNVKYVLTESIPDRRNDAVAYKKLLDDDFRARHLIVGCVSDDIYLAFFHRYQTAKSLLEALATFFAKPVTRLCKRYTAYKMPGYANVKEHLLKMRTMTQELVLASGLEELDIPDSLQVAILSNSLPDMLEWRKVKLDLFADVGSLSLEETEEMVKIFNDDFQERAQAQVEEDRSVSVSGDSNSKTSS